MLTVTPAQISFTSDKVPYSLQYSDHYCSIDGPSEESHHVFINGNSILSRWHHNDHFVIAELGFGFGINFITTANAWLQHDVSNKTLHYIAIEKHPVPVDQLRKYYQALTMCSSLTDRLLFAYPMPVSGTHRIHLRENKIVLTLIWQDVLLALKQANFYADAWYLDGFSPNKNPDMWSSAVAEQIFRLTRINGTLATYSVASSVRKNFTAAGFTVHKQSGFASKREMLTGVKQTFKETSQFPLAEKSWLISTVSNTKGRQAIVVGAGLAGCTIAAALAQRDWQVTLIDRQSAPAQEGSGNVNAILMPRLSVDADTQCRLTVQGFIYSLNYLSQLNQNSETSIWNQCGAIQLPRDENQWQRMQKITQQFDLPEKLIIPVSKTQASELAGCTVTHGGWYFPCAGWAVPHEFCTRQIATHTHKISFIDNTEITKIEKHDHQWHALAHNNKQVAAADVIVLANAFAANQLTQTAWCTLYPKRGQISLIPQTVCSITPKKIVCADAYITPAINGSFALGATFITGDTETDIREQEHLDNVHKLQKSIPDFTIDSVSNLSGRAAIRAVSSDRLPIVGPVAVQEKFDQIYFQAALGSTHDLYPAPDYLRGLYLATGFGSRGLAWIPICAEALACMITNEPGPLQHSLLAAIHPNRILMRQLVKRVQ